MAECVPGGFLKSGFLKEWTLAYVLGEGGKHEGTPGRLRPLRFRVLRRFPCADPGLPLLPLVEDIRPGEAAPRRGSGNWPLGQGVHEHLRVLRAVHLPGDGKDNG